jgi:hypothetical protein
VETPVGYRCRQCARVTQLPTFRVSLRDYLKATFAGLGASAVLGLVWMLVQMTTPFVSFFNFILAGAVGFGIGEAISRSVNKKRGLALKMIAGAFAMAAFIIGNQLTLAGFITVFNLFNLISIGAAVYVAVSRL